MAVSVQRRAADPAVVVIVLERRGDHALADTSARRERLQVDAARPCSGAVRNRRHGCGVRASIFDTSGDGTRGACGSESRNAIDDVDADVDTRDAVERVVGAMEALCLRRGVALGDGGVHAGRDERERLRQRGLPHRPCAGRVAAPGTRSA
jgi:hypothetical protein